MNIKSPGIFLFCAVSLSLSFLAGCSPVVTVGTVTPITPTPSLTPITETPVCPSGNCPSDSLTVTAVTVVSLPGDLGWGKVHGKIVDGNTSLPIEGALVKCEHSSYSSPYRCNGTAPTNAEGFYTFDPVFFHDTDRIILTVEAPGYASLRFEKAFFTQPDFRADLSLFPSTGNTPTSTPFLMCTAPACPGGDLVCGKSDGCPGGCGTICLIATTTSTP